jgi:hypothetical protein
LNIQIVEEKGHVRWCTDSVLVRSRSEDRRSSSVGSASSCWQTVGLSVIQPLTAAVESFIMEQAN